MNMINMRHYYSKNEPQKETPQTKEQHCLFLAATRSTTEVFHHLIPGPKRCCCSPLQREQVLQLG